MCVFLQCCKCYFLISFKFCVVKCFLICVIRDIRKPKVTRCFQWIRLPFFARKKNKQSDGVNELEPELELLVSAVAKELCVCLFVRLYLSDLKKDSRRHNYDSVGENIQRAFRWFEGFLSFHWVSLSSISSEFVWIGLYRMKAFISNGFPLIIFFFFSVVIVYFIFFVFLVFFFSFLIFIFAV